MNDFLSDAELTRAGFAAVGERVQVSRRALLLRPDRVRLGSDVRIDAFCVLAASDEGIDVGSWVHISAYTSILGRRAAVIGDFCSISVRCSIFTSDDDYSGETLVNPTVPDALRGTRHAPVRVLAHTVVGAGSVILPGVTIGPSAAVGALTLVKDDVPEFAIVAGNPLRRLGTRSPAHIEAARRLTGDNRDRP